MTTSPLKVLVVDDNPSVVWGIGRFLVRSGLSVTTCGDGGEAIEILKDQTQDVLVTDIQMPKVNGLALIEWVRAHKPLTRVIVMTAFGSPSVRDLSLKKGALLYLEKPVDPALLAEVLKTADNTESFFGSVSSIELVDYIQLVLLTGKNLILEVLGQSGERGAIFFKSGNVVHAECEGAEGETAFYRILDWCAGNFSTLPWREPSRHSIDQRGEFLLMEAARIKDEANHSGSCEPQDAPELDEESL